jgi:predicted ATPase
MITSLRLVNFKNFADETLHLGPFTLIVGANASGKSNIRDAFRFLHGIGRGYTLAEIMGGKYGAGGHKDWDGIRGAPNEIVRFGLNETSLEFEIRPTRLLMPFAKSLSHFIRIRRDDQSGGQFWVLSESLAVDPKTNSSPLSGVLYTSEPPLDSDTGEQEDGTKLHLYFPAANNPVEVEPGQPGLSQLPEAFKELLEIEQLDMDGPEWTDDRRAKMKASWGWLEVQLELFGIRFLELSPERMQEPAFPGATELGELGENLPTVLEAICADPKCKAVLLSWLHELTPMDVSDLEFPVDFNGRVNLRIVEADGRKVSAYSASDGTLRFLGLLAALLNEDAGGFYFFEEIDNGIHPARLHLLLDLIERQTAKGKIQVVATTHSPDVLNLINDSTFENAVVVYRDEDSANAVIRRVAELPNVRELRKSQGLGRLHASGWMENILSFGESDREIQKEAE